MLQNECMIFAVSCPSVTNGEYLGVFLLSGIVEACKRKAVNTLRTGLFKLFKRPFPGFLTILTV